MTKRHIALLYTGGTVGMEKTDKGYAPMANFGAFLSKALNADSMLDYTLHEYATPVDSANATPEDWQRIARDIAARYQQYDGFVVLHGTDTMAYTASALSFMLQGLRKPVIVTGSQIPLGEARSDALQNLITAMQLAASDAFNEVAIYFNQRLLRGNRATKISADRLQAFDSPNYPWLAEAGVELRIHTSALLPCPAQENFQMPTYVPGRILPIRFAPGLPVRVVQAMLDLDPQALIFLGYGAGNVPDRDPALFDVLRRAQERDVVLVACTQCLQGGVALDAYTTGSALASRGVVGAGDMTFEAVFAKLHHLFALGLSAADVRLALLSDLSGELTKAPG